MERWASQHIGVLAADTTTAIWDEIKKYTSNKAPNSVSRIKWKDWSKFPMFTTDVLIDYVKKYFCHSMTKQEIKAANELLPVRGIFCTFSLLIFKGVCFFLDLFSLMFEYFKSYSKDIPKLVKFCLEKAKIDINIRFNSIIERAKLSNIIIDERTVPQLIHNIFRQTVMDGQDIYSPSTNEAAIYLKYGWFIFSPSGTTTTTSIKVDLEPMFIKSIIQSVASDWQAYFFKELAARSKRHWAEDLLALMLIIKNDTTLYDFSNLLSDGEHAFDDLKEWKLCATKCFPQSKSLKPFLNHLTEPLNFDIVVTDIHHNAGPNLALLLQHISNPSKFAILVIQCKVKKYPSIEDVLTTLNPGNNGEVPMFRVLFSARSFAANFHDKLRQHNSEHPTQPFLVWTCSEKAFGKDVANSLTKGLPQTAYKPQNIADLDFNVKTSKKRKVFSSGRN